MGCCNGGCNQFTFGFPPGLTIYEQICYIFQQVKDWNDTYATITIQANTLEPGSAATAAYDKEKNLITLGIPQGEEGTDGFAPIARIENDGGTYTLNITGKDNIETATWTGLPAVTGGDIGKFMRVSGDGVWAAETVPNAETTNF